MISVGARYRSTSKEVEMAEIDPLKGNLQEILDYRWLQWRPSDAQVSISFNKKKNVRGRVMAYLRILFFAFFNSWSLEVVRFQSVDCWAKPPVVCSSFRLLVIGVCHDA